MVLKRDQAAGRGACTRSRETEMRAALPASRSRTATIITSVRRSVRPGPKSPPARSTVTRLPPISPASASSGGRVVVVVGAVVLVEAAALEVVVTGAVVVGPVVLVVPRSGPRSSMLKPWASRSAMRWARGGTSSGSTKTVSSKSSASTV